MGSRENCVEDENTAREARICRGHKIPNSIGRFGRKRLLGIRGFFKSKKSHNSMQIKKKENERLKCSRLKEMGVNFRSLVNFHLLYTN